jgi:outer membrane lipoprotein-sorting protein
MGFLSMVPLTVTIAFIYGVIGLIGKDYDMPVAVLSSLTLGLAVDFAIHFLSRARSAVERYGTWEAAVGPVFDEPARAIAKNTIVIAVGFLPLLAAPLVPYQTVGVFLATILAVSGLATLILLPALLRTFQRSLFDSKEAAMPSCNAKVLFWAGASMVATTALSVHQSLGTPWSVVVPWTLVATVATGFLSWLVASRAACLSARQATALVLAAACVLGSAAAASSPSPTTSSPPDEGSSLAVEEVVRRANHAAYYAGGDGRSRVAMTIKDKAGRARERRFTILRRNVAEGGDQRFFVHFDHPADVRRMTYLVWKRVDGDDDRWLYLPALDLVKRIAASDKRTSFVGSHFLYEDVSGRSLEADEHRIESVTPSQYVLLCRPRKPDQVEFSEYRLWIDRATFLPVSALYVDKQGRPQRRVEALEVKEVEGIPTVIRSRVTDLASGGSTETTFSDIRYGLGIPDSVFTDRFLRAAPRAWLGK